MSAKRLTGAELELIRRLFFRGLTWDGDLPSRDCCTSLRDRGLAQYEFGFVWLTPEGVEIAETWRCDDFEDSASAQGQARA
jgi:hypothetical protein